MTDFVVIDCPACGGTGQSVFGDDCPHCSGRGDVEQEIRHELVKGDIALDIQDADSLDDKPPTETTTNNRPNARK